MTSDQAQIKPPGLTLYTEAGSQFGLFRTFSSVPGPSEKFLNPAKSVFSQNRSALFPQAGLITQGLANYWEASSGKVFIFLSIRSSCTPGLYILQVLKYHNLISATQARSGAKLFTKVFPLRNILSNCVNAVKYFTYPKQPSQANNRQRQSCRHPQLLREMG